MSGACWSSGLLEVPTGWGPLGPLVPQGGPWVPKGLPWILQGVPWVPKGPPGASVGFPWVPKASPEGPTRGPMGPQGPEPSHFAQKPIQKNWPCSYDLDLGRLGFKKCREKEIEGVRPIWPDSHRISARAVRSERAKRSHDEKHGERIA